MSGLTIAPSSGLPEPTSRGPVPWRRSRKRPRAARRPRPDLVWLNLDRTTVMRQVTTRTIRRHLRRKVLCYSTIETPLHRLFLLRDYIVRWVLSFERAGDMLRSTDTGGGHGRKIVRQLGRHRRRSRDIWRKRGRALPPPQAVGRVSTIARPGRSRTGCHVTHRRHPSFRSPHRSHW